MGFLDDYEPVEERLARFWAEHPDGRIITQLLHRGEGEYVVYAQVWRDRLSDAPDATGLAQETTSQRGVNATSALENCETSAIGRALANLGYAPKGKRPSREEMAKAERDTAPETAPPEIDLREAIKAKVAIFDRWSEEERREVWLAHAQKALRGKPKTLAEVDRVIRSMQEQYLEQFPADDGRPF